MESFVYLHAYRAYQESTEQESATAPEILEFFDREWFPRQKLATQFRVSFFALMAILAIFGVAGEALAQSLLERGIRSSEVRTLQERLQDKGYFNATPTGFFGSMTENAVRRFQRENGLTVDGKVGPRTWNALYEGAQSSVFFPDSNPSYTPITPVFEMQPSSTTFASSSFPNNSVFAASNRSVLRPGDIGSDVERLQQELFRRRFYSGAIDGDYGLNTRRAVANFQRSQGLAPDGIAGRRTLSALGISDVIEPDEKRYVVVVPGDNEKLFEVRRYVANAFPADDRRGSYVNAGAFGSRAEAESRSSTLRSRGLDSRVAYF